MLPLKNALNAKKKYIRGPSISYKQFEESKYCSRRCRGLSKVWRQKNRESHLTEEYKEKTSKIQRLPVSIETRQKVSNALKNSEANKKQRFKTGELNPGFGKNQSGELNPNWKGGITKKNQQLRNSPKYKQWRQSCMERDKYTCQDCLKKGGYLQVHHINPVSTHPQEIWDVSNGKTLCLACHEKVHEKKIGRKKNMKKYTQKRAVLALSGGMDSTSLLIHLLANDYLVQAYSFDYGQKHAVELERVRKNVEHLQLLFPHQLISYDVIDCKQVFFGSSSALTSSTAVPEGHYAEDNMSKTVVEGRNAYFATVIFIKASIWAKKVQSPVEISLGTHAGDHAIYKDCRPEFQEAMEKALKEGSDEADLISYYTPYILGNKTSILQDCLENCAKLGIDFDLILGNTNTCYNPDELGRSCGKCGSCIERIEAFINIGRKDPVEYQEPWEDVVAHAKSVLGI